MAVIQHKVEMGGDVITTYVRNGTIRDYNDKFASSFVFEVPKSVTASHTPAIYDQVEAWRGTVTPTDEKLFDGYIQHIKELPSTYRITCKDKLIQLEWKTITKSYDINIDTQAGNLGEILLDVITTYGELNADATTIATTTKVVDRLPFKTVTTREAAETIIDYLSNWEIYYNPDTDYVYSNPKGETTSDYVIIQNVSGETTNVVGQLEWTENDSKLRNSIQLRGATKTYAATETFVGDNVETDFQIAHVPERVDVYVDGVEQVGGIEDSTETYDYEMDKHPDVREVQFLVAPGNLLAVQVDYSYKTPVPVIKTDEASIALYTKREKVEYVSDTTTVEDAVSRATGLLEIYSTPFMNCLAKMNITTYNIQVGEQVRIRDGTNNRDEYLAVNEIRKFIPFKPDEIVLGDEQVRLINWQEKIEKKIERINEELKENIDILTIVKELPTTGELTIHSIDRTSKKINDSFIAGHPFNGKAGMGTAIDLCNALGNWGVAGNFNAIVADNTHVIEGANALKCTWNGAGAATMTDSVTAHGNFAAYTGVANGAPTQGTCGAWVYLKDSADISGNITMELGSAANAYTLMTGRNYRKAQTYGDETAVWDTGWNYVLFDMAGGTEPENAPAWGAVAHVELAFTTATGADDLWVDYISISGSNYIANNPAGARKDSEVTLYTKAY